ncbi:hypothetical protein PC110_g17705 [Phytophthora cactorum]|uniref:Uncharacterized protein n=1 Tax=Phytophthora cactorum TaxID=29920 RepID=A0A329RR65_9STRA|nr:hypothetical protein PC110_g17705 [Phytophthora cactorum]
MIFGVGIHTGIDHVRSILNGLGDDMNRGALVDFRDVESGVLPLIGGGAPGNLSGEEKLQAGLWITKCQRSKCRSSKRRKKDHDGCKDVTSKNFATHGPKEKPEYCRPYVEFLRISDGTGQHNALEILFHFKNADKCAEPVCKKPSYINCPKRHCVPSVTFGDQGYRSIFLCELRPCTGEKPDLLNTGNI